MFLIVTVSYPFRFSNIRDLYSQTQVMHPVFYTYIKFISNYILYPIL